jgi:hypothetical protein
MEEQKLETTTSSEDTYVIHVQVVGGTPASIYEIGNAFKEFEKILPFNLKALITNDSVKLQDVDTMIKELLKLKKQLKTEEEFK